MRTLLLAPLMRFLGKLSYPRLFMVAAALFQRSVRAEPGASAG